MYEYPFQCCYIVLRLVAESKYTKPEMTKPFLFHPGTGLHDGTSFMHAFWHRAALRGKCVPLSIAERCGSFIVHACTACSKLLIEFKCSLINL